MIQLIAADLDGTLLDPRGNVPERFPEVFERLKSRGIRFAVASGRQYASLLRQFGGYLEDMLFIAENGAYVKYRDEILFLGTIPRVEALALCRRGVSIPNATTVLCGVRSAYIEESERTRRADYREEIGKYYESLVVVSNFETVEDEIVKVTSLAFDGAGETALPVYAALSDKYRITVSGHLWLDIANRHAGKGEALTLLQKRFHIGRNETMAFGDFMNDAGMLEAAGYGYAMENAHPDLFSYARGRIGSNAEHAVLHTIEDLLDNPSKYNG